MRKVNWAILGGGRMSKVFAETIFKDKNYRLLSLNKTLPELYSTETLVTYDNQKFFFDNSLIPGKVS